MKYFKFKSVSPLAISPGGWVLDFLKRQQRGLSGNFTSQGYPFNTPMWDGGVGMIYAAAIIYGDASAATPGQAAWWPYEQSAYLLDGIFKLAFLLNDRKLYRIAEKNFRYLLEHAGEDGVMGRCYGEIDPQWPLAVIMRALDCYGQVSGNKMVDEAILRHYEVLPDEQLIKGARHIVNLESLLTVADRYGNTGLIDKALRVYQAHDSLERETGLAAESTLNWSKYTSGDTYSIHGVTFSEECRLPVMLYGASGDKKYLDGAEAGLRKVLELHEQITGLPSSNEYLSGRDPMQGYESCLLTDFTLSLIRYLQATGDGSYADRIEKIIWNALPGAVTKDFSGLQYFSGPNQTVAASWSNHNYFYRGSASFRQYRPNHAAQCCPGNIHRAMPNYALSMFMLVDDGIPAAVLYGAGTLTGKYGSTAYTVSMQSNYPFEENIEFKFTVSGGGIPFVFRVPGWSRNAVLYKNGKKIVMPECNKGFCRLDDIKDGDAVTLILHAEIEHCGERQWSYFERGPLVYTLAVKEQVSREGDGRFAAYNKVPASKWNYAVLPEASAGFTRKKISPDPWKNPPVSLQVPGFLSSGHDTLINNRFTPDIPLFSQRLGKDRMLKLIPYGCTELRVTAFPDAKMREMLPVYQVLARPASGEDKLPEIEAFKKDATEIQLGESGYCDLLRYFGDAADLEKESCAWVLFRFISPADAQAVLTVGASTDAEIFLNGREIGTIPYPFDAEFFAPLWFPVSVKRGYNNLMMKVAKGYHYFQYPLAWGAKVQIFK
ncbi:MAG: hypothetical protein E7043_05045 [Lentisphaerae bacterium]|nr:hypothetical protein [Lentisphaerota bacterium]